MIREARVFLHHKDGHRHPVTVRVYQHVEKLKVIAMTDQLTELANRRYTELYINSKLAQLDSLHVPFSVAFIDIDHFKQVNDTYGHEVGDEVLRQVERRRVPCRAVIIRQRRDLFSSRTAAHGY